MRIHRDFNVTRSVTSNLRKKFKNTVSIERKTVEGRARDTMASEDTYLYRSATAFEISWELYATQEAEFPGLLFLESYMKPLCLHLAHLYKNPLSTQNPLRIAQISPTME